MLVMFRVVGEGVMSIHVVCLLRGQGTDAPQWHGILLDGLYGVVPLHGPVRF